MKIGPINYDNRKLGTPVMDHKFSCEEKWEDYLVDKLKKHFPFKTEYAICDAITACCTAVRAPLPREALESVFIKRLSQ